MRGECELRGIGVDGLAECPGEVMVGCGKGPEEEDGMVQEGALGEGLGRG